MKWLLRQCRRAAGIAALPVLAVALAAAAAQPAGAAVDYMLAARLARHLEAARQGDPDAQYRAGEMLLRGRGAHVDHRRALEWFRRAAASGHVQARYRVGYMLLKGLGTPPRPARARALLEDAARAGHAPARFYLGQIYALGQGVEVDSARALHWILASVQEGYQPPVKELRRIREALGDRWPAREDAPPAD